MNEKLMKRLQHNAAKVQDPTIKQLLLDVITELSKEPYLAAGMAIVEAGNVLEEQLEAMEALAFEAIDAVRNSPKGRLPTFMHRNTSKDGMSIAIRLPKTSDTHVIRSRACIDSQKKQAQQTASTSASANATEQAASNTEHSHAVDGASDVDNS